MSTGAFPPPFAIGQTYWDRQGEYTVVGTDENTVTIKRADGRHVVADAVLKARIHRNVVTERDVDLGRDRAFGSRTRRETTGRRKELMERILSLEADGETHAGVEIDQVLAGVARDLGYSDEDVSRLHPTIGRSVFANDGDWAKAKLTEERLHEVVGTHVYQDGDNRRHCNIYRITSDGINELRRVHRTLDQA